MQIVIEIPKEMYERIKEGYVPLGINKHLKNGTPLPKGHGRIGDLDRLYYVFKKNVVSADVFKELFDHAPTIIEADKEVNDG